MKNTRLKAGAAALALGFWLCAVPALISAQARQPPLPSEPFTAVVDGRIRKDLRAVIVENVPCLSLRDVQRLFGGRQSWQRVSRRVTYEVYGHAVDFRIDSASVTVGSSVVEAETPVRWWGGQVYVPLSLVNTKEFQEVTETKTRWDPLSKSLSVEMSPSVSSPRFYSYPEKSRVVIELGPRVTARVMSTRARRLYIRFHGGRSLGSERLEVKDGLIEEVQLTAGSRSSDLAVSLSAGAGEPKVDLLNGPRRLVVEVYPAASTPGGDGGLPPAVGPVAGLPPAAAADPGEDDGEALAPPSAMMALSPIKTVVIDAGHGGKDAGAVGPNGTLEKDVNLETARALARVLKRERRFRVILTRNDDTFIPLQERTEIANKNKADLFVSIHSNSALSKRSNGFEIYFLSEKATDDAAAATARRENAVVELEGVTDKAKQKVQELLWALAKTETMNESAEVAALMNRHAEKRAGIPNRGVKQAGFYVLKGANMPAVLVECGFISNPKEEGLLRSRRFQAKLAEALYAGLLDYEKRKIQARPAKVSAGHENR